MSFLATIDKLAKAIQLEEGSQFIDLEGNNDCFSSFMRKTYERLYEEHEIPICQELSKKFEFYPSLDLNGRIHLVNSAKKAVVELKDKEIKTSKIVVQKNTKAKLPITEPWETDVKWISGVGEVFAKTLNKLAIFTVQDLLFYWPRQHLNFSERVHMRDLKVGADVTVVGIITKVNAFQSPRNPNLAILNVKITDPTGSVALNKFIAGRSNKFLLEQYKKQFPQGALVMASGRVQYDKSSRYQLSNFSVQTIEEGNEHKAESVSESLEVGRIVPIYALTEGLSQNRLRRVISNSLEKFGPTLEETLPVRLLQDNKLPPLLESVKQMHFPESDEELEKAKRRIAFEEFFFLQLPLAMKRQQNLNSKVSDSLRPLTLSDDGPVSALLKVLPFELTGAQRRVFNEIMQDLTKQSPMNRLVQGDVGSGKTIVALLTMLIAVERNQQAALMAPTEILAEQHFRKFQELLSSIGLRVALLIGSQKAAERRDILTGLSNGQIHIVVGTHALIQEGVEFSNLGIVVIDEQHRFGVKQRDSLRRKGGKDQNEISFVDCLHMTATPIPRTLALSMYGNLDLSEIDEMPPGRKPIKTKVVQGSNRTSAHEFVKKQLAEGRQAYIVYPLIEESESLSAKAVTEEAEKLKKIYKDYQVGIIHGRLFTEEKDQVMSDFRQNKIQVLVGTTVIEVGVDVPNATIMIIENAERFGLAQLHQLRGRVGRGSEQSYCLLFGNSKSAGTMERLQIMEQTENGFIIAQKDLELRGPGELMGTRQSGLSDFGLASLLSHGDLLEEARQMAIKFVSEDPELKELPASSKRRLDNLREKAALLESG